MLALRAALRDYGSSRRINETDLQCGLYHLFLPRIALLLSENGSARRVAGGLCPAVWTVQLEDQTGVNQSPCALVACGQRWRSKCLHATDRGAGALRAESQDGCVDDNNHGHGGAQSQA